MAVLSACDGVFGLTRVQPPPPDVLIDAPTVLDCTTNPITLRPNGAQMAMWADQYPTAGTHLDKIADTTADDDLSYIASAFDGQLDLFTHVPLASTVRVESIVIWIRARTEVLINSAQVGAAFLVSTGLKWDDLYIDSSWSEYSTGFYVTNPATNQPWTVDEVNALAFGVRKAYSDDRVRVTQIWATVACR
jgi:hypothetical protein